MSNSDALQHTLDTTVAQYVRDRGGLPGVVAQATDASQTFYEAAFGNRVLGTDLTMTSDSVFAFFSAMKPMTAVCALQLIEEGVLSLADEAGKYVPQINDLAVLTGFDADGTAQTRSPKRPITVRDLFLHTSGLAYEFFSSDEAQYHAANEIPTIVASSTFPPIKSVLHHDPGAQWTYGTSLDWLGLIVEELRGTRLSSVMRTHLFDPLEMHDVGFYLTESMLERTVPLYTRDTNGALSVLEAPAPTQQPEMDMGGHGLYGSVGDFMKFIRMVLNDGEGPHGRVLGPRGVELMHTDGLAEMGLSAGGWKGAIPTLSNSAELMPGVDKGWTYSYLVNRSQTATGRSAGSLSWAGLANTYFWIDRTKKVGGFWATSIFPFIDVVSYPGFLEFESAVYAALDPHTSH